ncbi:uncharacterized protein N7446_005091 [Penicillium canescens]|nr:uncharacterized protein N7446_005091 [Penicillium canescens]KAJ6039602.1 hypothetical protein N7444_008507 [Penicillium canescens]KAJ6068054.1 hypothetical protein N7446_005091 [Penicillium canescens]
MSRTPLLWAATKRSKEAAELMRFLLVSGADANAQLKVSGRGGTGRDSSGETFRTSAMEKGAQNISKWLDMSWDDLVKMAGEQKAEIVG